MSLYSAILLKIAPLYMNMLLGYAAVKFLDTSRDTIARLMFFMINPIIIFNGVLNTKINASALSLPVVVFCVSTFLCLTFYNLSKRIWDDQTVNLVAFGAGTGNTGYFGLPIALLFFNDRGEGLYIMSFFGMTLYENTLGYYICTKGTVAPEEGWKKLLTLPTLHAFLLALIINLSGIGMPAVFTEFMIHIKGTYAVLGMMIIGLSLANIKRFAIDVTYLSTALLAKFILWPLCMFITILLDQYTIGLFDSEMRSALMLVAIVPMAVNTVVFAAMLKMHPEKAAGAVLLSTLLALVYVPFMVSYFVISS